MHLWLRAEIHDEDTRAALSPGAAAELLATGFRISVEHSDSRIFPDAAYADAGCAIVPNGSWPDAPAEAIILGLDELPEADIPLRHRHIFAVPAGTGDSFAARAAAGGGTIHDLNRMRADLPALDYWTGFTGAAITLRGWAMQIMGEDEISLAPAPDAQSLSDDTRADLNATLLPRPQARIIGAETTIGQGAADLCAALGVTLAAEAEIVLNCRPDTATQYDGARIIGDLAFSGAPGDLAMRLGADAGDWDMPFSAPGAAWVMALDTLPALLPHEFSRDFSAQILPLLGDFDAPIWAAAKPGQ
ncbi:MAG: saccharopine dehydrogenase [Paracoccaceae bacterium]